MSLFFFPVGTPGTGASGPTAQDFNGYTFKNIQDEVLSWIDESDDSNDTVLTNVKNAINQAHMARLQGMQWNFMLWPTPLTFSTVAGVQTYSLHSQFVKGYYFFNRNSKQYLREMNSRQIGPSGMRWNTDTGSAREFTLWGRSPLQVQPQTSGLITIISSAAGDAGKSVVMGGTDSTNSYKVQEIITCGGTNPNIGTVTFSNPITNVTLSEAYEGTLTIKMGSLVLLVLQPGELSRSYPQMFLMNNPTSSEVIEYRFFRQPTVLINDYDSPDIPPPFQRILVWDALIILAAYNTDPSAQNIAIWSKYADKIDQAMIDANDEGNTLESEPRYVRSTDDYNDFGPRFN